MFTKQTLNIVLLLVLIMTLCTSVLFAASNVDHGAEYINETEALFWVNDGGSTSSQDISWAIVYVGPDPNTTLHGKPGYTMSYNASLDRWEYTKTDMNDNGGNPWEYQFNLAGQESAEYLYNHSEGGTTNPGSLVAPSLNNAVAGDSQVSLSWGSVANAAGYNVKYGTTSIDVGNVTNYTVTGLTNGTAYTFTVAAYNSNGESPDSNQLTATPTISNPDGVLWEENFDTFNSDLWTKVTNGSGNGNQELQYYLPQNVSIEEIPEEPGNNALVLTAKRENWEGKSFTSGKVDTNGKVAIQYGIIEVRMKVPDNLATGLWPAAWLLGSNYGVVGWPKCGEIDMMEMGHMASERAKYGVATENQMVTSNQFWYSPDALSDQNPTGAANRSWENPNVTPYIDPNTLTDRFLTYRLYWNQDIIRFAVEDNGVEHFLFAKDFTISEDSDEFRKPFFMLLNLAVGGTFTDAMTPGEVTAPLPGKVYIDYVKVKKWNGVGEVKFGGPEPETGTFGVFTDNTPTNNKIESPNIYAWEGTFVEGTIPPYEGENGIGWQAAMPGSWFGGHIAPNAPLNMSNYADGNLRFMIKIPADVSFKIGVMDTYTNEHWVEFPAYETKYGLVRNGEWGQVTIPISELKGELIALQSMKSLFAIVSVNGDFSSFQLGIDDIYWQE
ncbi:hypothetical protein U472_06950 [Orenia metallireducens]|uniref:Uncharacterized protein n=1 Tax=Orenia metallireducens TaxID=1413210 RepID=A0A1C0AA88_9FIRM|nr:family 16 glycosylhydrolase [Orenia metallireducens]OCL27202.1 hypothetical protein U472_06950 [Orenia metallireducens]